MSPQVQWKQRLQSFRKSFTQLEEFIDQAQLNRFEELGLIKCFGYNYELSWNAIKDFYQSKADVDIQGAQDAFRLAFSRGLIIDDQVWMDMIKSRALTSHTYNEDTAKLIINAIRDSYFPAFAKLLKTLEDKK